MIQFGFDRSAGRLARARGAAEQALELDPESGRGHLALGYYHYWGLRDYESALRHFALAEARLPNDSGRIAAVGYIRRREGDFAAALTQLERAFELDPRNGLLAWELGNTYRALRRYARADALFAEAIELAPERVAAHESRAWLGYMWTGDTEATRAALARIPGGASPPSRARLEYLAGRYDEALRWLAEAPEIVSLQDAVTPRGLWRTWIHDARGEPGRAGLHFDAARETLEGELRARPEDHRVHSMLGLAYAGLGRKDDAIRHGRRAANLLPLSEDALLGPAPLAHLARIYAGVGESAAALDLLERLLALPAGNFVSVPAVRRDPRLRALREDPRYLALVGPAATTP